MKRKDRLESLAVEAGQLDSERKDLEQLLDDAQFEMAQLEHERDSANHTLETLKYRLQEICQKTGHQSDPNDPMQCMFCGFYVDELPVHDRLEDLSF